MSARSEFVEVDPTGRYGRYDEILGRGSSKTVYRAFDEYEGMEVAWNQVKLRDFFQSPEQLERLCCEIHLLKTLNHRNIMKFYTSWLDAPNRSINFVTEMFTSGTLRQYRQRHRKVHIRAVKSWCRQILAGLLYLHSRDPPVIHRDLKCDNIFVNGNQGQVKIGDLGLAAILRNSHADHCVGTPEFMAPEVYAEQYNELVDIYSFGMCVLEMVTFEYPYSECAHPAHIYKKVMSGTMPDALYKVEDPEVRRFVEKCLASASHRLPARELIHDPFLRMDDDARAVAIAFEEADVPENDWGFDDEGEEEDVEAATNEIDVEIFSNHEDEHLPDVDITIRGKRKADGSIYLKLRITDKEGRRRNIHFPFDTQVDTALSVATEMVSELDIVDFNVLQIAEMIHKEVASLAPEWRRAAGGSAGVSGLSTPAFCGNCASAVTSYGSLSEILAGKNLGNLPSPYCSRIGCMHGRFAEITYRLEGLEQLQNREDAAVDASIGLQAFLPLSEVESSPDNPRDIDNWASEAAGGSSSESISGRILELQESDCQNSLPASLADRLSWLEAEYQIDLGECSRELVEEAVRPESPRVSDDPASLRSSDIESLRQLDLQGEFSFCFPSSSSADLSHSGRRSTAMDDNDASYRRCYLDHKIEFRGVRNCVAAAESEKECVFPSQNFYNCSPLPGCLSRTKSLPVDAIDS